MTKLRLSLLSLILLYEQFSSCDTAGLRGNEQLWRSSLIDGSSSNNSTDNDRHQQQQQPPKAIKPLVCELDPLVNDSGCDILGQHPTTPVCFYDDTTHEYKTVCVETDTSTFTARLQHPNKRTYCGKCRACFQTKDELQAAIAQYQSHTQVNMELATTYGWPIGQWCMASSLQDFSKLFFNKPKFNEDISSWRTSHVTNMDAMFQNAYAFNQPLNDFDTSSVTSMARM